ncbi:hypothetical protein EOPP23_04030 [Endozoicomonas sp. OPT23]|uniref:SctK family type III secretion system sorting platform protein n=1 Tax=Endozoicomonas sp. OPT23 TaxID=2072845 RepID=UPI00129BE93D|nr:SctK family type III secretion system sorting platform protein [Endozoicomonas sp. OPT23]MRI32164.1 hypothetical protein [Endozoicomonas sp. OPT23]
MNAHHPLIDQSNGLELFQSVAEFNLYLIRYIHPSWLKTVKLSPLVQQLRQENNADYHLSHYLLKQFQLNNEFDYEFIENHKRIALADEGELTALALYTGATLNEGIIRNALLSSQRQAFAECLGEPLYRFATQKAQFIARFDQQLGPSLLIDWDHLEQFKHYLLLSGLQVLGTAFSSCPEAFKKRLLLKMPTDYREHLESSELQNLSEEQCQKLLIKVYKEVNKEWHHLLS